VWLIEKYLAKQTGFVRVSVNAVSHECVLTWDNALVSLSELMLALNAIGYRPQPVTMVAVALYAGAWQDIEQEWASLLRWLSLLVATPVVLFSAQPFWSAAIRNVKQRHLTMDVPVSIAIILAYCASFWATMTQTGEVYFDSVAMFTFQQLSGNVAQMLPHTVNHFQSNEQESIIPLNQLAVGDHVRYFKCARYSDHLRECYR